MSTSATDISRLGVNTNRLEWYNRDWSAYRTEDPDAPVVVEGTPVRKWRLIVGVLLLGLYASFWIIPFVYTGAIPSSTLIPGAGILGVALMTAAQTKTIRIVGIITELVMGVITIVGLIGKPWNVWVSMTVLLLLALSCGYLLSSSRKVKDEVLHRRPVLTGNELWNAPERRTFGTPGQVASATGTFGEAAMVGADGERDTAELLKLLLVMPGTTVYHGLCFPGSAKADVDHAVVHGSTVYLIDSKKYGPGTYFWSFRAGSPIINGGLAHTSENHMDEAAAGYRRKLGAAANIVPLVLVHGRGITIKGNSLSREGVRMLRAHDALDFIGSEIAASMDNWRDNRALREFMRGSLKTV